MNNRLGSCGLVIGWVPLILRCRARVTHHATDSAFRKAQHRTAVSLGGFFQDHLIEREVRDRVRQPGMLPFEFFQPFGLGNFEPTVLVAPSVVRVFGDPPCAAGLSDGLSLAQHHLSFTQFSEGRFNGVTGVTKVASRPPFGQTLA